MLLRNTSIPNNSRLLTLTRYSISLEDLKFLCPPTGSCYLLQVVVKSADMGIETSVSVHETFFDPSSELLNGDEISF